MIELVLVLVVAAIVALAAIRWLMTTRRGLEPTHGASGLLPHDAWFVEAREVVRAGLVLVEDLEPGVSSQSDTMPDGSASGAPIGRLDDLTHRLAELTTTAPSAMDGRVCRSAAVRSRALSDALRGRSSDPTAVRRPIASGQADLLDRRAEFETALHDLAEHVNLL